MESNIKLNPGFGQVCIWPGTTITEDQVPELVSWFKEEFNTRVQYLETIITKPNKCKHGLEVAGTGGRHDIFMAIHNEDVGHFAIARLNLNIRWIEDALGKWNEYDKNPIYPERVKEYCSWDDPKLEKKAEEIGKKGIIKTIIENANRN